MWVLAGRRVDRETETWLLWELPLDRALQYYHCALREADLWTVRPGSRQRVLNQAEELVNLIRAQSQETDDYEIYDDETFDDVVPDFRGPGDCVVAPD